VQHTAAARGCRCALLLRAAAAAPSCALPLCAKQCCALLLLTGPTGKTSNLWKP